VQDAFRLAIHVQPEVTLYDVAYYDAGVVMASGLETGGDLYCRVDDFQIGSGHVRSFPLSLSQGLAGLLW
jgi:hypothetical protein